MDRDAELLHAQSLHHLRQRRVQHRPVPADAAEDVDAQQPAVQGLKRLVREDAGPGPQRTVAVLRLTLVPVRVAVALQACAVPAVTAASGVSALTARTPARRKWATRRGGLRALRGGAGPRPRPELQRPQDAPSPSGPPAPPPRVGARFCEGTGGPVWTGPLPLLSLSGVVVHGHVPAKCPPDRSYLMVGVEKHPRMTTVVKDRHIGASSVNW